MTMANPTGELKVKAGGKEYRLHLGMSVLAELQEEWGERFDALLSPEGNDIVPSMKMIHSIFTGALQRHHGDQVDRWLVDDIIAENISSFGDLLAAAFPSPQEGGVAKGKKKAAA